MSRASRSHAEAAIELLRGDPAFADEYLRAAMEQADQEGGREALFVALRQASNRTPRQMALELSDGSSSR